MAQLQFWGRGHTGAIKILPYLVSYMSSIMIHVQGDGILTIDSREVALSYLYDRWHRRRSRNMVSLATNPSHTGLDPAVVKTLPVFTFSDATHKDQTECAVCLSEFEEGESGRVLPGCKHAFHVACIDMWFHSHSTCPLCRSLVEPPATTTFTYNSLINGFCIHGRLPNIVTYTTFVHGFCKSKRVDDGVRLFNEMSLKGLAANTVTYTVFIQGYCLVGKPHVAQEVFNQMGSSHNGPPDIRTYNVLLDGLCYNGKVEKALMIFEYMQKREMDVKSITSPLVSTYKPRDEAKDGDDVFSLHVTHMRFNSQSLVLRLLLQLALFMLNQSPTVTYTIVIQGMCKVGKVEDDFDLFCSLFSKGMKPNVVTYTTMITGFCRRGLIHDANALFKKMKEDGFLPNERTCVLSRSHRPTMFFFAATDPSHTVSRGLDPDVLKSLPVFTFSDAATHEDPIECAVCLSEFEEGESGRVLPGCKHAFHVECIDMWFHSHSTCPLCRSLVVEEPHATTMTVEEQVTIMIAISREPRSGSSAMPPLDDLGREPAAVETTRRSFSEMLSRKGRSAPSSFAGAPSSSCQVVMNESGIERGGKEIKSDFRHVDEQVTVIAISPEHVSATEPVSSSGSGSSAMPLDDLRREPAEIETPRRIFSEFEDGLTRNSPVNHSPMSRMLSFTRMVSRNRRSAPSSFAGAPSQSPSSSCQVVMNESDIERGGEEIKIDFRHVGVP
ncbi:hypothetical protein IGI04_003491 [Brassica rapa subsp. trilocularis]|uniref:RING-type E3 ubiquitin transferase n=1 Tax=Brassica rapa subsp. trilocularis TaxID=1813537 RepID=A0ABQ7NYJ0_BRACM|nr:hypothetical protein IGI04_003491 [Brassica rapa subsp. trilocularis]